MELALVAVLEALCVLLFCFILADAQWQHDPVLIVAALVVAVSAALLLPVTSWYRATDRELTSSLREAAAALHSMIEIVDPTISSVALDEYLDAVLQRIQTVLNCDVVALLLVVAEHSQLQVRAASGAVDLAPVGAEVPLATGVLGAVVQWARPVVVKNASADGVGPLPAPQSGIASLMAAPLLVQGEAVGVIMVGTTDERSFGRGDLRLLQVVGDRCASSIEHARLDEGDRRSRLGMNHAQLHLRILARGTRVLDAALASYDDALGELGGVIVPGFADWFAADILDASASLRRVATRVSSASTGGQTTGTVALDHTAEQVLIVLAIRDLRPQLLVSATRIDLRDMDIGIHTPETLRMPTVHVESMLVVPVSVAGECRGALSFATMRGRRGYRPSDVETARQLAERVGVAIQRVTSFQAAEEVNDIAMRFADRLHQLIGTAMVTHQQLAEERIVELMVEHAQRALGADVVAVGCLSDRAPMLETAWAPKHPGVPGKDAASDLLQLIDAAVKEVKSSGRVTRHSGPCAVLRQRALAGKAQPVSTSSKKQPSLDSWIAVPLTDAAGTFTRVVVAVGAPRGAFSSNEEWILTLLAQLTSIALLSAEADAHEQSDAFSTSHPPARRYVGYDRESATAPVVTLGEDND